jgi:hypothetical protein
MCETVVSRRALLGGAAAAAGLAAAACAAPSGPPGADQIVFPVGGSSTYTDTFGAPRSGGRTHQGQDIMAARLAPAIAAVDGVVSWLRYDASGNYLILKDDAGWTYYYVHLNNDSPGTDDGRAPYELAFADGIRTGQRVRAGEVIGYVGDSGDAESTAPHLHFEMRRPDGTPINPYAALRAAARYQRSETERLADSPTGVVDAVVRRPGGDLGVTGWAIDAHRDDPVTVSVYVAGTPVLTASADAERPDLAAARPGRGTRHGFALTVPAGTPVGAGASVCVIAHSIGGGGSSRLSCTPAPA